jgi:hemerythrin-like domain-containing protein
MPGLTGMVDANTCRMTAQPMGPIQTRLVMDHEELDVLLDQLITAYETNDRAIAAAAYTDLEQKLSAHLDGEEQLLFPDFERSEPEETNLLREDHRRIRARVDELGVGVDLHSTRIGAIRELVQMLRAHVQRENALLYRWADRAFSDPAARAQLATFFAHGRSPVAPVQS